MCNHQRTWPGGFGLSVLRSLCAAPRGLDQRRAVAMYLPAMALEAHTERFSSLRLSQPELRREDRLFMEDLAAYRKPGVQPKPPAGRRRQGRPSPPSSNDPRDTKAGSSSLPALRGSPSATSTAKAQDAIAAQYMAELDGELAAKRRLVQMRRAVRRTCSEASLRREGSRRAALAAAVRSDLDERRDGPKFRLFRNRVTPANDEEIAKLAETLMRAMALAEPDEHARGWFKLYKYIDKDRNGQIEYYELLDVIRDKLQVDSATVPDEAVQAFWLAVDADQSGAINLPEFGKMMRLAERKRQEAAAAAAAEAAAAAPTGAAGAASAQGVRSRAGVSVGGAQQRRGAKVARPSLEEVRLMEAAELADFARRSAVEEVRQSKARLDAEAARLERQIGRLREAQGLTDVSTLPLSKSAGALEPRAKQQAGSAGRSGAALGAAPGAASAAPASSALRSASKPKGGLSVTLAPGTATEVGIVTLPRL